MASCSLPCVDSSRQWVSLPWRYQMGSQSCTLRFCVKAVTELLPGAPCNSFSMLHYILCPCNSSSCMSDGASRITASSALSAEATLT